MKPAPHPDEVRWIGKTFSQLTFSPDVRVPRPVATGQGEWIVQDHVAWTWIEGKETVGNYDDKLIAARAFHTGVRSLKRPSFVDYRSDPWALADRVAWSERSADYDAHTMTALAPILEMAESASMPEGVRAQVIHGDLSGNFVFADGLSPGIIDITPYWRPEGFAEAVIWIDSIWFSACISPDAFVQPGMATFVLRALARRLAEQPEQVAAGLKTAAEAAGVVTHLNEATEKLLEPWLS